MKVACQSTNYVKNCFRGRAGMDRKLDVLFVEPDSSLEAYQALAKKHAAVEPPTWALLLANSVRSKGYGAAIIDCVAERLTDESACSRSELTDARIVCFTLYGQNPNSSTTSMIGATRLAEKIKQQFPDLFIVFVGNHTSAIPEQSMEKHEFIDCILLNEGVYALHNLLGAPSFSDEHLEKCRGILFRSSTGELVSTGYEALVPSDRMDIDLPGHAWDLLPYTRSPLDLYRSHFWHTNFDESARTPFAAIYTSLGCRFKCDFCMINIINRTRAGENITSADSALMRYWSPDLILKEMEILADYGVESLRLSDEMFFLNRRHYESLLTGVLDRNLNLNMWTYSRVDSVNERQLDLFKSAGVNWLCLGIEAGNQDVRKEISKGKFQTQNVRDVVAQTQSHGINVLGNYMFGFPDETYEDLESTLDLALELNTEHANFYPAQALPGSPLHREAVANNIELPKTYAGYAFLSYDCQPLPTKHLSAKQVLEFRDMAWNTYFSSNKYLSLVESKFGLQNRRNVEEMSKLKLKRRLLEERIV